MIRNRPLYLVAEPNIIIIIIIAIILFASSLMAKSNTRVELQYKMADSGKNTTTQSEHVSMTKLSTADRYWRNLSFLMYKGRRNMRSKKRGNWKIDK